MGGVKLRVMQEPLYRHTALTLYRAGSTDKEVAHALGVSLATLRKEKNLDPGFAAAIEEAQGTAFQPVIRRAIELAMEADVEGDNEGSHKAMALVMQHYGKVLSLETQVSLLEMKLEAGAAGNPAATGSATLLVSPEAAAAFAKELTAGPPIEVEEAEVVDDGAS